MNKMTASADVFSNSLGKLAVIATGAITGVVTGVVGAAVKSADAYQSAMNTLQASTGATGEEMQGLSESMKGVYANNFGESWDDVANSLATVNKFLSGTGENIQQATEYAIGFRDTFGYEVPESMRAADALMKNFGVNSQQAFNLMAQGEQQGLDYSGELIDSINEYSVQFGKVGLGATDMFNIFNDGMANGAWNLDKIGDAVKEFSIRAIDGSKTTADGFTRLGMNADEMTAKFGAGGDTAKGAFIEVTNAIKNMNDPVEQSLVGVDLFGTMWEDTGAKVITNLGNIGDNFNETIDTMSKINEIKYNSFGNALVGIKRQVETSLLPLGAAVLPILNEFANWFKEQGIPKIQNFATAIQNNISPIEGIISGVVSSIFPMLSTLISLIGDIATTYFGNMSNSSINLQSVLEALVSGGFAVLKGALEFIRDNSGLVTGLIIGITSAYVVQRTVLLGLAIAQGVKTVAQWASIVADKAETVAIVALYAQDYILAAAHGVVTAAQWALNAAMSANPIGIVILAIVALVAGLIYLYKNNETVRNAINAAWEFLKTNVIGAVVAIKDWCILAWEQIKSAVIPIVQAIGSFISSAWEGIKTATAFVWEVVKAIFLSAWIIISAIAQVYIGTVIAVISVAWQVIKTVTTTVWNAISSFFISVWNGLVAFIQPIVTAISTFISSAWTTIQTVTSTIWNAIVNIVTTIWNSVLAFITPIITTIITFITNAWNAILSVTTTIWNLISTGLSIVFNVIYSLISTVITGWINIFTTVWTTIQEVTSTIWNGIVAVLSGIWNTITSTVSTVITGISTIVSGVWDSIFSTTSTVWEGVKSAIMTPINAVVGFVSEQVEKIKGFFSNMNIQLPHINLPHFKVEGELSLSPPSVPHLGVDWYAKGTSNAAKGPAIVGEKGPELLYMNGGEKVIPNNELGGMFNQTPTMDSSKAESIRNSINQGDTINHNEKYVTIEKLFDNVCIQSKEELKKLLDQIGAYLEEELFNGGDKVYAT